MTRRGFLYCPSRRSRVTVSSPSLPLLPRARKSRFGRDRPGLDRPFDPRLLEQSMASRAHAYTPPPQTGLKRGWGDSFLTVASRRCRNSVLKPSGSRGSFPLAGPVPKQSRHAGSAAGAFPCPAGIHISGVEVDRIGRSPSTPRNRDAGRRLPNFPGHSHAFVRASENIIDGSLSRLAGESLR